MNFLNNWIQPITLAANAYDMALDLPDGDYTLTIANAATGATSWEIIRAMVRSKSARLSRGYEGTSQKEWPSGSVIYCSLTAGTLDDLLYQLDALTARVAALEGIVVTSKYVEGYIYGAEVDPGQGWANYGEISPKGASTKPGADAAVGADGELIGMSWSPNNAYFVVKIRGNYSSVSDLPFTAFTVNGTKWLASEFNRPISYANGVTSISLEHLGNTLPVGRLKIVFS